ncbi:MAG: invasion associated locus B family protein [Candidatus Devosia phytovorans]|uniref:Invasion associated locus B family protein n=1 Tax=Candidatus Devosia phytovorans TaxID=3121372 RepID=A0AAJ6AZB6_9HYPH|nr:invasion associated locus B family protein [Devosia sp.]WEK04415.1 MAG: invasion associated locus B family protein [Devosia sp.]
MRNLPLLTLAIGLTLAVPSIAQDSASGLPGGARSLNEEHGDWTVSCRVEETGKLCVMAQTLASSQSGQPVFSLELATPAIDKVEGMMLLPFGLRLADGVQLSVDGTAVGETLPFLTCVSSGCLVPVAFDASQVSALRAGTEMIVRGSGMKGSEPVELKVSLAGFARAANRSVELSL